MPARKPAQKFQLIDGDNVGDELVAPFDPERWFLASSNSKGMRNRLRFDASVSIPPVAHAVILKLIESDETPYRSVNDFVRDACFKLAQFLTTSIEKGTIDTTRWKAEAAFDAELRKAEANREALERVEDGFREARNNDDQALMGSLVEQAQSLLNTIEEPYRTRLGNILMKYTQSP